ncbi:hypothetical protein SprV_0401474500 [Sparganum proliferum]
MCSIYSPLVIVLLAMFAVSGSFGNVIDKSQANIDEKNKKPSSSIFSDIGSLFSAFGKLASKELQEFLKQYVTSEDSSELLKKIESLLKSVTDEANVQKWIKEFETTDDLGSFLLKKLEEIDSNSEFKSLFDLLLTALINKTLTDVLH